MARGADVLGRRDGRLTDARVCRSLLTIFQKDVRDDNTRQVGVYYTERESGGETTGESPLAAGLIRAPHSLFLRKERPDAGICVWAPDDGPCGRSGLLVTWCTEVDEEVSRGRMGLVRKLWVKIV